MTDGAFAPLPADKLHLQVPLFSAKEHLPKVGGNKYVLPVQGSSIFKPSISYVYIFLLLKIDYLHHMLSMDLNLYL